MNASHCTKQLRILSGTHAGASLDLSAGIHCLDALHDCDISVTDWRFAPLSLLVDGDAVVAQWDADSPQALRLEDFVPIDFAGIVLCIGPCSGEWPDRQRLFASLRPVASAIAPPATPTAARPRIAWQAVSWGVAMILALVTTGWIASASSKPARPLLPTLSSVHESLQRLLDRNVGATLKVSEHDGDLVVEGMVDDAGQARRASDTIEAARGPFEVVHHVSVATDVVETIRTAVGLPDAHIAYRGNGEFSFSGVTSDVAVTQSAVNRVAADLAPTIRRIDTVLEEPAQAQPPMPAVLSALATSDGVDVMETRDGVKHLVITSPTVAATASNPGL